MARLSLGHLVRAAGQGLSGYRRGQNAARADQLALERQQLEFAIRVAPELRRRREEASLDDYLRETPEGRGLVGRGLSPTAQMRLYTQALTNRRQHAASPTPRQAQLDVRANAQSDAELIARRNVNPSAEGIYAALRVKGAYRAIDDEVLRRIARDAVSNTLKRTSAPDFSGVVERVRNQLGQPPKP